MVITDQLRRPTALAFAALILLASMVPLLSRQKVDAAALLGPRQIKMSTSQVSATGTSYRVKFQVTTHTSDLAGIVVTFCEGLDSPIIGDTACTVPAGFTLSGATISGQTTGATIQDDEDASPLNTVDISTFATAGPETQIEDLDDSADTDPNTVTITRDAGTSNPASGDYAAFTINGVTNPSPTGTFYARIYTYDAETEAQGYTLANPDVIGASIDAGGIALSTAAQITVTAKVQERITFCVYTDGDGNATLGDANTTSCSGVAGTSVILGDTNGVLTDTGPFVNKNHAMFNITTNASQGATIRTKGATLTSGSFTINAIGGGTVESEADDNGGTEEYGFCAYQSNGTGLTIDADYDGDDGAGAADDCTTTAHTAGTGAPGGNGANNDSQFAFITAQQSSTYGSRVATKAAGEISVGRVVFVGNITATTEPGIYTSTITFIATGNY